MYLTYYSQCTRTRVFLDPLIDMHLTYFESTPFFGLFTHTRAQQTLLLCVVNQVLGVFLNSAHTGSGSSEQNPLADTAAER
jgi:hypothetical protein